jgi:hypothetical protein
MRERASDWEAVEHVALAAHDGWRQAGRDPRRRPCRRRRRQDHASPTGGARGPPAPARAEVLIDASSSSASERDEMLLVVVVVVEPANVRAGLVVPQVGSGGERSGGDRPAP